VEKQFRKGVITDDERKQELVEIWTEATNKVAAAMEENFDELNPIYMMANSGARGNMTQIRQIAGMRGLVANPRGEIIERPIKSNFREGLSVLEYFISTHGARKGLADTALRTADSGYLTRRLVDIAQDLIIREEDCGTDAASPTPSATATPRRCTAASSPSRSTGRGAATCCSTPARRSPTARSAPCGRSGQGRAPGDGRDARDRPAEQDRVVRIRTVLNCDARNGVCALCYGRALAEGKMVQIGEAVGIIAAQSIGEPGTQLTMRTFHTGGVAGEDITHGLPRVVELFEARTPKGKAEIAHVSGTVSLEQTEKGVVLSVTGDERGRPQSVTLPRNKRLRPGVGEGDHVEGRPAAHRGLDRPARHARGPRGPRDPAPARQRGAGGLPLAGRVDPRQAHRADRPPDAAARHDHRAG
jgi:DNA-directed RNA polymerase subunit beta'